MKIDFATTYNGKTGLYNPVELYPYQERMLAAYDNYGYQRPQGTRTIILCPRQMGKTLTKLIRTAQVLISGERKHAVILVSTFPMVAMVSEILTRFFSNASGSGVGIARHKMSNFIRLDNGCVVSIAAISSYERYVRGSDVDLIVMDDADCSNGGTNQALAVQVAEYAQRNQIDVIATTNTFIKRPGVPSVFSQAITGENDFRYEVVSFKDHPHFGGSSQWQQEMRFQMGDEWFGKEFLCGL